MTSSKWPLHKAQVKPYFRCEYERLYSAPVLSIMCLCCSLGKEISSTYALGKHSYWSTGMWCMCLWDSSQLIGFQIHIWWPLTSHLQPRPRGTASHALVFHWPRWWCYYQLQPRVNDPAGQKEGAHLLHSSQKAKNTQAVAAYSTYDMNQSTRQ